MLTALCTPTKLDAFQFNLTEEIVSSWYFYIDAEPMKNHQDNSMIQAYQNLWARTTRNKKEKPTMHVLDNKASVAFKAAIKQTATYNWYLWTHINGTWQREQFKKSRATSLPYW
jgi:hypothetical protein